MSVPMYVFLYIAASRTCTHINSKLYIYIYIYISSCRAASTDFPDSLANRLYSPSDSARLHSVSIQSCFR